VHKRTVTLRLLTLVLACALALALGEAILRAARLPGITYHSYAYDPLTGGTLYPGSRVLYRGPRGDFVERRVNRWGYLDVDHAREKPEGTVRIGFFGDSYVAARQVPLEETFFRRIQRQLGARVEVLAFGIGARGTVQSYLDCSQRMAAFDLDRVVYVFCENDPGDQLWEARRANVFPYAALEGDSFRVDYTTRAYYEKRSQGLYRPWQALKARSLVLSTIDQRLKLLKQHGLRARVPRAQLGEALRPPRCTAPSTWPSDSLLAQAQALQGRVMERWMREVTAEGRRFAVLYARWGEWRAPPDEEDSWAPWLRRFCAERGIALIDPTPQLVARMDGGLEVHYDHYTPHGHEALAEAFVAHLAGERASEDH